MKIDYEYIKKLLLIIEQQNEARPHLQTVLEGIGLDDITEDFLLHYEVLIDYGFIKPITSDFSIGIEEDLSGGIFWSDIKIRLTASGHEFIEALRKPEIWTVIKDEFKESSVKTLFKVATDIVEGMAKKKVEQLLGDKI